MKNFLTVLTLLTIALVLMGCPSPNGSSDSTAKKYTVTYLGNGNTGGAVPVDSGKYTSKATVTVLGNTGALVKTDNTFIGWTTTSDGSGTIFTESQTFNIIENSVFYAKWTSEATYTITYNGNTNTEGTAPVDSRKYLSGSNVIILGNPGGLMKGGCALAGWNTLASGLGTGYQAGASLAITENITLYAQWISIDKFFRAQKITDSTWYDCPSVLMATGVHVLVYAEYTSSINATAAQAIATEFDTNIYNSIKTNFGDECDVDANGKIILLLLDIVDGYSSSSGYVAGYFDPTHEYDIGTYNNSNEADMLFLDINPAVAGSDDFYGTIAHEFQHMINWENTENKAPAYNSQDIWINEGLSSGAEYIYAGAQIQSNIDYFNADPIETIEMGNNFYVWDGYWESAAGGSDVLADYSTVYLFFQWLRIHASNGSGIYKEILASNYRDYHAVTDAAASRINASFGTWSELLGTWMMANILGLPTGYKGYLDLIDVAQTIFTSANNADWSFSPGEGIVSLMPAAGSNTPPLSGANIIYIGITSTGTEVRTAPYTGEVSLVYNANTDIAGADETGYIANIRAQVLTSKIMRSVAPVMPIPSSYPIEIQLAPGGGLESGSHKVEKNFNGKTKGKK